MPRLSLLRRSCCLWAVVPLMALSCSVQADDKEDLPPKRKPEPSLDIESFAELPVRYNGRVTSYDRVARNYLRRISGRRFAYDEKGGKQPAIRWLLDTVSGHRRGENHKILHIKNEELRKLLQLPDRSEPRHHRFRYSMAELGESRGSEAYDEQVSIIRKKPSADWTPLEQAVAQLRLQQDLFYELGYSHLLAAAGDPKKFFDVAKLVPRVETFPAARALPPHQRGEPWKILLRGSVEAVVARSRKQPVSPAFEHWIKLLRCYEGGNAAGFNRAVKAYHDYLKTNKAWRSPIRYRAPKGWDETGVPVAGRLTFYGDTFALGIRVAAFKKEEGEEFGSLDVNFFPGKTAEVAHAVNFWRIAQGLVPLGAEAVGKITQAVNAAGADAAYVDILTPDTLPRSRERSLSAIVKRQGQTWVISINGSPAVVERERKAFESFLKSIRLGKADALKQWLGVAAQEYGHREQPRVLGAILRDKDRVWVTQLMTSAEGAKFHQGDFEAFVRSLRIRPVDDPKAKQHLGITWSTPKSWQRQPTDDDGRITFFAGDGQTFADVTVDILGQATDESALAVVNFWRGWIQLPPITKERLPELTRKIEVERQSVTLFDFTGRVPSQRDKGDRPQPKPAKGPP